jgi:hypothetical protein
MLAETVRRSAPGARDQDQTMAQRRDPRGGSARSKPARPARPKTKRSQRDEIARIDRATLRPARVSSAGPLLAVALAVPPERAARVREALAGFVDGTTDFVLEARAEGRSVAEIARELEASAAKVCALLRLACWRAEERGPLVTPDAPLEALALPAALTGALRRALTSAGGRVTSVGELRAVPAAALERAGLTPAQRRELAEVLEVYDPEGPRQGASSPDLAGGERRAAWVVRATGPEARLLRDAARRAGLAVPEFVKRAALAATRLAGPAKP